MNTRRRTTAALFAGAVALASGAYAMGSQQSDGGAVAATIASAAADRGDVAPAPLSPPGFRRGAVLRARAAGPGPCPGPFGARLDGLAKKLGVPESKLRAALEDLRPPGPPRFERPGKELADALGVSESRLREALGTLRPQGPLGRGGFAKALADALNLNESDVRAALEKLRSQEEARHQQMRDAFATKLADKLGIPKSRVLDALGSMPHPPMHGPGPW